MRTPEPAFRLPILQALAELGGSSKVNDVLDRVGQLMEGTLRPVDFERLVSEPSDFRWRNTAHWARLEMVHAGLLKEGSKRGVWEITDQGRAYLTRGAAYDLRPTAAPSQR